MPVPLSHSYSLAPPSSPSPGPAHHAPLSRVKSVPDAPMTQREDLRAGGDAGVSWRFPDSEEWSRKKVLPPERGQEREVVGDEPRDEETVPHELAARLAHGACLLGIREKLTAAERGALDRRDGVARPALDD